MTFTSDPESRILTLDGAVSWRDGLRREGRKLVVTNGCFDLLHRGHASYLRESRELGDALLVLVNSDASVMELKGPSRPVVDEHSRAYLLCSLRCVDAAVIFGGRRCAAELDALTPDVYVKGGDYTVAGLDAEELAALRRCGAEIVFKPFVPGFSSSGLIGKIRL